MAWLTPTKAIAVTWVTCHASFFAAGETPCQKKRQAAAVFRIARKIETISAKIEIAYKLCAPRQ